MIVTNVSGALGICRISRQEKANSLTETMMEQLVTAFQGFAENDDLRAVILTGEGRVFSAGADLDEARAGLALSPLWERLSAQVAAMPCLTIAALNGTVAGGAMGMVLACDLRLAVAGAKFFYPVMRLGFLPQPSDVRRLVALVGGAKARMILMAGQKIPAPEALSWGLIDRIADEDGLLDQAQELAGDVFSASQDHVSAIKAMIAAAQGPA